MNYLTEWETNIINDFEKLLVMTEESSLKIDYILQSREKQRIRLILITVATYIFAMFFTVLKFYSPFEFKAQILISMVIATSLIIAGGLWVFTKNFFIVKKINRELHVERDIHERLISLLDEQKQRLHEIRAISPVALAVYEIRMRRIDRTDKKIY